MKGEKGDPGPANDDRMAINPSEESVRAPKPDSSANPLHETEPNESIANANSMEIGQVMEGAVGGADGNADWFRMTTPSEGTVIAIIANTGPSGSVGAEDARYSDGKPIGHSTTGFARPNAPAQSKPFLVTSGQTIFWSIKSWDERNMVKYQFQVKYTD